jgi:hypothetical protein
MTFEKILDTFLLYKKLGKNPWILCFKFGAELKKYRRYSQLLEIFRVAVTNVIHAVRQVLIFHSNFDVAAEMKTRTQFNAEKSFECIL